MQRFLKEEDRVALRTQQIGLRQFCYQGGDRQIAKALLNDDQLSCRNLSRIWATTYMKVSDVCAHVLEPYSSA
ncbi:MULTISPECIES: hypothetical protein [Holospora]|uniref:Uncharacterized protein n=2 Tax=Holospora TaxID=44747 RepID=A0A061JHY1_9PROT|nr:MULTISPECIES: hypothetical protein [Holospora]ETZ04533.1 hypothetical protein K737_301049 [Holospora undulata HU1]ETZ05048.1 hypothetical protein K737_300525 [Holospora undulata HU1]GAJ45903.1 hypothetical protein HE1_00220 [Holospora elegans E1]